MKCILGTKQYMTQTFKDDGTVIPVTVIEAGPCYVTQIKTKAKEGYEAIQIGFEEIAEKKITKPMKGHYAKIGHYVRNLKEVRINQLTDVTFKLGDEIKLDIFKIGDHVNVTAISKGRGFQGVVKRHGFSGGPATHGHKDQLRMPGSIGATDAQRVLKGKKMGGHMGTQQVTVKNLEIIKIDTEKKTLLIKGAVPGARGTLMTIIGK